MLKQQYRIIEKNINRIARRYNEEKIEVEKTPDQHYTTLKELSRIFDLEIEELKMKAESIKFDALKKMRTFYKEHFFKEGKITIFGALALLYRCFLDPQNDNVKLFRFLMNISTELLEIPSNLEVDMPKS